MKQHALMLAAALALTATAGFAADGAMMAKPMDKGMEKPMDVSETMMKHDDGMMMKKDMSKPMDSKMDKKMMPKDGMMKKDTSSDMGMKSDK